MDSHEFFDLTALPELHGLCGRAAEQGSKPVEDDDETNWDRFQKVLRRAAMNPNADDFRSAIIQMMINPDEADMELSDKMSEVFRFLTEWKSRDYFLESIEYRCGDDNHVVKFQNYDAA